jgi:soluble P-type ATPase
MNELEKISQRVYVSSGTKNGSITEEENIKNLSTALSEWWLKKE